MENIDRNAPCPCGSTKKYKHCCQRKEKAHPAKPGGNMAMVPLWLNLALDHLKGGRRQAAKAVYEQILQLKPDHADALQWLGVIFHQQGNSEKALELIRRAIAQSPQNASFHSTLGNVLQAMGQADAAVASYGQAIRLNPSFAEAHNNLGIVLFSQGKSSEAIAQYQQAIQFVPKYAEAYSNLGIALQAMGLTKGAEGAFAKSLAINPNYSKALLNLGCLLQERNPEQAFHLIWKSLQSDPNYYEALISLGKLSHAQGDLERAAACFNRAMVLRPSPGLRVLSDLMIPPIMGTHDEVAASRLRFERNLEQLCIDGVHLSDPLAEFCNTNFHLAYHGLNDKSVQINVANFYAQACPSLLFVAPHCARRHAPKQKKRIGFLSRFITGHSVALCFSRVVAALAATGEFEVTLLSTADPDPASIQLAYPDFAGKYIRLTAELGKARDEIALLELNVLVYLDIGMEAFSYFLAFARLAEVQCVVGGHPVTTGIKNIDYFLTSDMAEPEDAENHYSEKLVRLSFGLFYFQRPRLPSAFKSRLELGLPATGALYMCPMTLHKLHPDFDEAIARILQVDHTGHVILIADKKYSSWKSQLEARLNKSVSERDRARIVFVPWVIDPDDFISLNKAADVILDSFHFGLGTTGIVTCAIGTPFVTKPSAFMRGRIGLFYAKILCVMECVAQDVEDYAQKAVAIATRPEMREGIKTKILANNHILFENPRGIQDGVEFFRRVETGATR